MYMKEVFGGFVRTNSRTFGNKDKTKYNSSIVFIEDTKQIYANGIYYGSESCIERVEFNENSIELEPNKFYYCNDLLDSLDISLIEDELSMNTYFVEFLCNNTQVYLPVGIHWENNIIPDFTKIYHKVTIKIQDDTAYLINSCILPTVHYSALKQIQPNRADAFGAEIITINDSEFILNNPATEIKEGAFEGNTDLISMTIPKTVKKIGARAFANCTSMEEISYTGSVEEWDNIELDDTWDEESSIIVKGNDGIVVNIEYLTFTAQQSNSTIGLNKLSTYQTLEYSYDKSSWSSMNTSTTITLSNIDDKVYLRGILSANNTDSNYTQFKMTGKIAASGNINSIWNYRDLNASLKRYCGCRMFYNCTSLTTTPELPATELADYCYQYMFKGCTSLTTAPELLPATTLTPYCYSQMFYNCTSLTVAPELPATTLATRCYNQMFESCTSLTVAQEILPATTLAPDCCIFMFRNCTSLTTTPELPATVLAPYCYTDMFYNCTSLTTAPELPATVLTEKCYSGMFSGCDSLTIAPELPATVLTEKCYSGMFYNCSNLNYIKCLAISTSATSCTSNWVIGVSSTGTFIKHPNTTWTTGASGIPNGWEVVNVEN